MTLYDEVRPYIVIGGGRHAAVIIDTLQEKGLCVIGYTEKKEITEKILGVPCIGCDEKIINYDSKEIFLANGLGSVDNANMRKKIFDIFTDKGYLFPSIIARTADLSLNIKIEPGAQIMRGAVVQHGTTIGKNSIINTSSSIDHDCYIDSHVHIAPGVTMSGGVRIGEMTHVGTGAVIIQNIRVGNNALISAGAVVVKDVKDDEKVRGLPARLY